MPEEELQEESNLFSHQRNITISNFIVHKACQLYYKSYKKKAMPLSFVEFVFNEFKRYDVISIKPVLDFFEEYKINDLPYIIRNYETNFYTLIVESMRKSDEFYLKLQNNDYMDIDLSDSAMFGNYDPEVYTNLENIAKHIETSDELLNISELYEQFMIRKVVLARSTQNRKIKNGQALTGSKVTNVKSEEINSLSQSENPQVTDITLVGDQTDIPNQRGKIVKLYFPKLMLPSPYPVLQDKSRINSEHRARKFMPIDKQIQLINKIKFNRVKYKTGFIEKRKVAQKPQKRKFDFDF